VAALHQKTAGKAPANVLFVGLDAAGKTTALYRMKVGEIENVIPTIGFNVEKLHTQGVDITSWDMGGRGGGRAMYRHYMPMMDGIVFMVDSNDRDRMPEATDELTRTLLLAKSSIPVLVFANKQDLPAAMSMAELGAVFETKLFGEHPWKLIPCTATTGVGLNEGLKWLAETINGQIVLTATTTADAATSSPQQSSPQSPKKNRLQTKTAANNKNAMAPKKRTWWWQNWSGLRGSRST